MPSNVIQTLLAIALLMTTLYAQEPTASPTRNSTLIVANIDNQYQDKDIYCNPDAECTVQCTGEESCRNAAIHWPINHYYELKCEAMDSCYDVRYTPFFDGVTPITFDCSNSYSCINLFFTCPPNATCNINCGPYSCTSLYLYCHDSSFCNIGCNERHSCEIMIVYGSGLITNCNGAYSCSGTQFPVPSKYDPYQLTCGQEVCGAAIIICPLSADCSITCEPEGACGGATIICPQNASCDVTCQQDPAQFWDACEDTTIVASSDPLYEPNVDCNATNSTYSNLCHIVDPTDNPSNVPVASPTQQILISQHNTADLDKDIIEIVDEKHVDITVSGGEDHGDSEEDDAVSTKDRDIMYIALASALACSCIVVLVLVIKYMKKGKTGRRDEEILEDVMDNECNENEVKPSGNIPKKDDNVNVINRAAEIRRNAAMEEEDESSSDSEDRYRVIQKEETTKGTTTGGKNTNDAKDEGLKVTSEGDGIAAEDNDDIW